MDTYELLIRTQSAAKEARESGFDNTADVLDRIVGRLLKSINSQAQLSGERRVNCPSDLHHLH